MTINVTIATVADAISKLAVDSLTILDIDEIKVNPDRRGCWLLPAAEFITDVVPEILSFGASSAAMNLNYTLNYFLLYEPVGTGRTMTIDQMSGLVGMLCKIWIEILSIDVIAGCENVEIAGISEFGPVAAPNGDEWWGCGLSFRILEFVQ